MFISFNAHSQFGTSPYNAPSGIYTIPPGVTSLTVTCYGGGGGGGGGKITSSGGFADGGGGGGGAASVTTFAVTPGTTITVAVGASGSAGANTGGSGGPGGTSSVTITSTSVVAASAAPGLGGTGGTAGTQGGGGLGGTTGTGTVKAGGNGGAGFDGTTYDFGGGGGGGGGTTAIGSNGTTATNALSAAAPGGNGGSTGGGTGGIGGFTSSTASAGVIGNTYGGGGGGCSMYSTATARSAVGGAGAAGAVIIAYTVATYTSIASGDWSVPGTWSPSGPPTAGSTVIVNTAVTLTSAFTNTGSITINSGASLTTSGSGILTNSSPGIVTVNGSLIAGAQVVNTSTFTVNNIFQLNAGGYTGPSTGGTNFTYGATGTLNFNNTSAYGVNNTDLYWPTSAGPYNVNVLQGGLTLNSASRSVNGLFSVAGASSSVTAPVTTTSCTLTLNGTAQINAYGYFASTPTYGSGSTLVYNVSFGVYNEWTGNSVTAGSGNPQNVTIQNGSTVTLPGSARGMAGNLNVTSGTLTLNGGDLTVGGSWTRASSTSFNPSGRTVYFGGSTTQVLTVSGGETFNNLQVTGSGTLQLASAVNVTYGNGFQLGSSNTTSNLDLNGQTFTYSGGGNLNINGGSRKITSSVAGGVFAVPTFTTIYNVTSLLFGNNVTLFLTNGIALNNTTIGAGTSGVLKIGPGGYVTVAPTYATNSLLQYAVGTASVPYGRGTEWSTSTGAGYPYNVQISSNTANSTVTTVCPAGSSTGSNNSATVLNLAGNLTIDAGNSFYMQYGSYSMSQPLIVGGILTINGNLGESTTAIANGDIIVKGAGTAWVLNTGGSFATNTTNAVSFSGTAAQTIGGTASTSFYNLIISNSANVTLGISTTVSNVLTLGTGLLNVGSYSLSLGAPAAGYTGTSYIVANTGSVIQTTTSSATTIPIGASTTTTTYAPITITAAANVYTCSVSTTLPATTLVSAQTVNLAWSVVATTPTTAAISFQWNAANDGSGSYVTAGPDDLGVYGGSSYTTPYAPFTPTGITPTFTLPATGVSIPGSGPNKFVIGNQGCIICNNYSTINNVPATPTASIANASTVLGWSTPTGCYSDVLIVVSTSPITATPSGSGYSGASLAYAGGTVFGGGVGSGGGYIVYEGAVATPTITGLTNGTTYYIKFFTRYGSAWSSGTQITVVPNLVYCTPTFTNLCSSGDYINNFSINTLSNAGSGCNGNTNNYINYPSTSFTTTLTSGSTYTAALTAGAGSGTHGAAVWFDFNNNGSFEDGGEYFLISNSIAASGSASASILIPSTAPVGTIRMRVRYMYSTTMAYTNDCGAGSYGETEDYTVTIVAPATPTIVLSTNTVAAGNIAQGSTNNVIASAAITVTTSFANLTGFNITTTGPNSSSDLTNLKVWYQNSSTGGATFGGGGTVLSTLTTPGTSGNKVFPSFTTQNIPVNTTGYIFVTADVPCTASTSSNTLTAATTITSANCTFALGTPTGSAAAGGIQTYVAATPACLATSSVTAGVSSAVASFTFPTTGCYSDVMIVVSPAANTGGTPASGTAAYTAGTGAGKYNLAYGTGASFGNGYVVYEGTTSSQTITGLTNGNTYYVKYFVRLGTTWIACGTEQTVTPTVAYCTYSGTGSSYFISSFSTTGGVSSNITNNYTTYQTGGYGNYSATMNVNQVPGGTVNFSVTWGSGYSAGFGIWVDWNNDGTFQSGEEVFVTNTYYTTLTGSFSVPSGTSIGNYRMRIVGEDFNTAPSNPCATSSSGYAEDYTINIIAPAAPTISSFTPTALCSAGGQTVTITGNNFAGTSGVSFGTTAAASFVVVSNTSITAVAPAGLSASSTISVTNSAGTGTSSGSYTIVTVSAGTPAATTVCNSGTSTLSTSGSTGTVYWYDASAPADGVTVTSSENIGTGTSITSPTVTASGTTYYEQSFVLGSVATGGITPTGTQTQQTTTYRGLYFTVTSEFMLNSVDLYPSGTGSVTIALFNSGGTQLQSSVINVTSGSSTTPFTANLGWDIPVGTGYYIIATSVGTGQLRSTGVSYTTGVPISTVGSITGQYGGTNANYYFYFYNWKVAPVSCSTSRTAVVVPYSAPTVVPAATTTGTICAGTGGTASLTYTAGSGTPTAYSIVWTGTTGLSNVTASSLSGGSPISITVPSTVAAGTYTGTLTVQDATGCTGPGTTFTLTVNGLPATPIVTPTSQSICTGTVQTISVTNYGASASPSTTASGTINLAIPDNSATGKTSTLAVSGIPASATITGVAVTINITHTDDYDLTLALTAPNGNTLNLVNSEGGANFTNTVVSSSGTTAFSSSTGPYTGTYAADASASAPGATGYAPNVTSFSSLYTTPNGNWTFSARDNAAQDVGTINNWTLTITYTVPTITWTTNVTGLYNDLAASSPYTNAAATTVYAKPTTNQTYTATATGGGCTSTATSVINVGQPSTAPTSITSTINPVCSGTGITLTAGGGTLGTGANYQWGTGTAIGTNPITGATLATYSVTPSSTTTYWVSVANTTPCSNPTGGATLHINVGQPSTAPTSITSTINPVCSGTGITLTANGGTLGTGANYQWGTGTVIGSNLVIGATSATYAVTPSGTTTYWVSVTNTTPCSNPTGGATLQINVGTSSTAPTSITSTINPVCSGTGITLTASGGTLGTGANYQWGTGTVIGSNLVIGATSATYAVTPSGTTTYWVSVTNTTPCSNPTGSASLLINVSQPSTAPNGISGNTTVCSGASTTLTALNGTLGTGATYQWGTGTTAGVNPIVGATSVSYTFTPTVAGSYWVSVTGAAPCGSPTGSANTYVNLIANQWLGGAAAAPTDWNTPANWCSGQVPTSTTDVYIPSGGNQPTIGPSATEVAVCQNISIASGATLTMANSSTLTISAGASYSSFGSFSAGNGTVIFIGAGAINTTSAMTFNNLTINGGLSTSSSVATNILGTFQINTNGYITNAPTYGSASTLTYNILNATYSVNTEWTGNSTTAGTGVPNNVVIQNGTALTMPNGANLSRGMAGSLNIVSGSLTLGSNTTNDDLYIAGNWTRASSAAFYPNQRAVFFDGTGTQIVTVSGGGTEIFNYMQVGGTATLQLAAGTNPTTVWVNYAGGLALTSTNTTSTIDLNGQTMILFGGGNLNLNSGNRFITSSTGTGYLYVKSNPTTIINTGSLTFQPGTVLDLQNGLDGGASGAVVINSTLEIDAGGYMFTPSSTVGHAPTYGTNSLLLYNTVGSYTPVSNGEWYENTFTQPGVPYNVTLANNSSGSATSINFTNEGYQHELWGTLTIGTGTTLTLNPTFYSSSHNGDLNVKGNWINNGTFYCSGRLVTFLGTAAQTITGATTFDYLGLNNSAGLSINNDVTVTGQLFFTSGIITTGTGNNMILTSTSSSAVTGYNSTNYINGNLRRYVTAGTAYDLPVGTASSYQLANIKFDAPSLGTTTYLTAKFNSGAPTAPVTSGANACVVNNSKIGSVLSVGSWTITPDNQPASGATYTATLSMTGVTGLPAPFTDAKGHTVTTADLIAVVKRDAGINGGNWTGTGQDSTYGIQAYGTHYDSLQAANTTAGTATVTRSGIPSFSDFAIGVRLQQSTFALPVQLIYFAAEKKENDGYLTWATASEINNDHFDIERSVDGVTFVKVGTVAGHGNSNQTISYDYTDPNIVALNVSTVYYRLNQVDIDGHSQYSNIAAVDMTQGENTFHITSVYPNPFTDHFSLSIYTPAAQTLRIAVYNVTGQIVSDETVNADAGLNVYNVSKLSGLASGFYTLNINAGLNNYSYKVIKGE